MRKNVLKLSVASLFFIGVGVYGQKSDTITKERKIDEVIVVGYGKSTKAKLTDNVAKISSESFAIFVKNMSIHVHICLF